MSLCWTPNSGASPGEVWRTSARGPIIDPREGDGRISIEAGHGPAGIAGVTAGKSSGKTMARTGMLNLRSRASCDSSSTVTANAAAPRRVDVMDSAGLDSRPQAVERVGFSLLRHEPLADETAIQAQGPISSAGVGVDGDTPTRVNGAQPPPAEIGMAGTWDSDLRSNSKSSGTGPTDSGLDPIQRLTVVPHGAKVQPVVRRERAQHHPESLAGSTPARQQKEHCERDLDSIGRAFRRGGSTMGQEPPLLSQNLAGSWWWRHPGKARPKTNPALTSSAGVGARVRPWLIQTQRYTPCWDLVAHCGVKKVGTGGNPPRQQIPRPAALPSGSNEEPSSLSPPMSEVELHPAGRVHGWESI